MCVSVRISGVWYIKGHYFFTDVSKWYSDHPVGSLRHWLGVCKCVSLRGMILIISLMRYYFFFVQNVLRTILMNSRAVIFRTTFDFSTLIFTACLHIFLPIASVSMTPEHITCNTIYAHFLKRCLHYSKLKQGHD